MKISTDKNDVIHIKKDSIRILNNMLESLIKDGDYKKAQLISKWIKDYCNYIYFEDKFDPKKNISYKRGDIVKVNFGFNIGSELGGVHYAVVIDNDNRHSSNTMVVVPLSSLKEGQQVYDRDVDIGSEFFNTFDAKLIREIAATSEEVNDISGMKEILESYEKALMGKDTSATAVITSEELTIKRKEYSERLQKIKSKLTFLQASSKELSLMKTGSVAKVEQIRAISKERIWDPQHTTDVLYGIRLSANTMDKINTKIKELFLFESH